jgi:diguanylate cyclase (GGDEF)-like protein
MIDIDHFKRINDTYGHNIGDKVLTTLANIVKESLRKEDYIIRWGGEEFVVLLFDTVLLDAKKVIDRIREKLMKTKIVPIEWDVSFSSGIAGGKTPENIEEIEKWIENADEGLYKAKENGRNRIEIIL